MGKEVIEKNQSFDDFKEKLTERIREDIGSLLPDEAVQSLIEKAVQESFFEPRLVEENPGSWNSKTVKKPAWFVEEVAKACKPMIKKRVSAFIANNKEEIQKTVDEFLDNQNLMLIASTAIAERVNSGMWSRLEEIYQRIQQPR